MEEIIREMKLKGEKEKEEVLKQEERIREERLKEELLKREEFLKEELLKQEELKRQMFIMQRRLNEERKQVNEKKEERAENKEERKEITKEEAALAVMLGMSYEQYYENREKILQSLQERNENEQLLDDRKQKLAEFFKNAHKCNGLGMEKGLNVGKSVTKNIGKMRDDDDRGLVI